MDAKKTFGKHYRRILAEGILRSALWGAVLCLAVNTAFAFLHWMLGFGTVWLGLALGLPLGAALAAILYFIKYRPTEKALARRIDRYGLHERMITMVELQDDGSYIAALQRSDAVESLAKLPERGIRLRLSAAVAAFAAVLLTASVFLGVLGALADGGKLPYGNELFSDGGYGVEVVYTVEGGGFIRGEASQSVCFGESGSSVRAVAEDGWAFLRWDDGATSPERREENVRADITLKAIFTKIDNASPDEEDSDSADDLPVGGVSEESGGESSDELGGDNVKDDGEGSGGGKWQDRNQFIDGATYYRDYLEFYYQYATGIFESYPDIPDEIIEFFETYFSGI